MTSTVPPDSPLVLKAHGKLLLSSEYVVLDGALALAVPTQMGQQLRVDYPGNARARWQALDHRGTPWFEATFTWPELNLQQANVAEPARRLMELFQMIDRLRPGFLKQCPVPAFSTQLEFPRQWGLGTSSTLITLLAQWAGVDPFDLLRDTFGGSGYDIACALARGPLLYRKKSDKPYWVEIPYRPAFQDRLYFIYLGKKQDSREGIRQYRARQAKKEFDLLRDFDRLSWSMACASSLAEVEALIREHEDKLSRLLDLPRAKGLYFPDYSGEIKSLGAWGGDFVLATGLETEVATRAYFQQKGFDTILKADELLTW